MISLIVALDNNHLIGNSKGLPWYIPEDLKYFRDVTRGKTVIMGRKTHESIGRLLPNRTNVIVTRQTLEIKGAIIINDLESYLKTVTSDEEVFIIGGAEIYRLALPYVKRLYITHIDAEFTGDTYFPSEYFDAKLTLINENSIMSERGIKLTFAIYEK